MPILELKSALAAKLASHFSHPDLTADAIANEFSTPPNLALGHVAYPCFRAAKALGKPAGKISQELAATLGDSSVVATAAGPYANFKWNTGLLYEATIPRVLLEGEKYGSDSLGKGQTVVLEYCSPNMAKRLGFAHIRSTVIGASLANVYSFLGFQVERINFLGDWGSQFGKLLSAIERWGQTSEFESFSSETAQAHMDRLLELYVRFHKEVESDPSLTEDASHCLQRLEQGEARATQVWRTIRDISIETLKRTLSRLSVSFDHWDGESSYIPQMPALLQEVKDKAGAKLSEGAWIVELEDVKVPALIQKRDGTTLYLTRDIAAARARWEQFKFDRSIYVVSEQQKLHFQQLFGVIGRMGHEWSSRCEHVSFGTVLFGAEKMSTREGRVVLLDDILDEAKRLALAECTAKNPELANKERVAEMVGTGAVIFGELSAHRMRDIEFSWKHVLAFDGETAPYVQYAHVRCASLLQKAQFAGDISLKVEALGAYEFAPEEEALILSLGNFRTVLNACIRDNEPYHVTNFLLEVAKAFNRFYYRFPVLQATDPTLKGMRLNLVVATRQALANGLKLLGISVPEEM